MKCIYPGSFDPLTVGHLNIIKRAAKIFDEVVVAILINGNKKSLFSLKQRTEFIEAATRDISNIKISSFEGLLIDFINQQNIKVVLRGVRQASDYEYEMVMAYSNKSLQADVETIFMPADSRYVHVSSGTVRELLLFGADISSFVPGDLAEKIQRVYKLDGGKCI